MSNKIKNKNLIIILAGGIYKNGTLKKSTKYRVEKGVKLFKKDKLSVLLMSGSWSFMLSYKPVKTEAKAMQELAFKLGVPKNRILLEEKSNDTIGNAYFTKINFIANKKWNKIIIVTSKYHLKRTKYIFKKIFGLNYKVRFVGINNYKNLEKLKKEIKQENKLLKFTKQWFDKIKDGDDKKIKNILLKEHPGYSKNPKYSIKELLEKL